jgi:hypothetical protein
MLLQIIAESADHANQIASDVTKYYLEESKQPILTMHLRIFQTGSRSFLVNVAVGEELGLLKPLFCFQSMEDFSRN